MINKHRIFVPILGIVLSASFMLSGCDLDPVPELTEGERDQVAEYAVGMLMKYDLHHKTRLLDEKELEVELERLRTLADNKVNAEVYARRNKEATKQEREQKKQDLENTPTVDSSGRTTAPEYIEDFLGLDGFSFRYAGFEIHPDYYPESGENLYFSVPAADGKDIMVLNFVVTNTSGETMNLDMPSTNASFIVKINGEKTKFAELSLLDNDLAMCNTTLAGGESKTMVLLVQVDEDLSANITSVEVSIQSDSKIATIQMN